MKVEFDGKTLWHVQSVTYWSDEPYDTFIFSEKEPSKEQIKHVLLLELDGEDNSSEIRDLLDNANVYTVYAEEL